MPSNINSNTLTKEQLFACLEHDGIAVDVDIINMAKNNDGKALRYIGVEYKSKKQDYSKAMAWYRLATNQNNSLVYNDIGVLYHNELGVSQDCLTAMEYYLKAARGNNDTAMSNIGHLFFDGCGVSIDKYKSLEWYIKSGKQPEQVQELNEAGVHIREEDKNKTIYHLINETEDIVREARIKRESELKGEMENLREEYQTKSQQIQLLLNEKDKTIALLHNLVESKTHIIQLLQRDNQ